MFNKLRYTEFAVALLFVTIVMTWIFKLNLFPGLHADEAWFGIRAHIANNTGRFNWHGMNHYTGSLQEILSASSFELFGRGVFQLRIIGVFCNIFGLLFIINNLIALFPNRLVALVFMLLLSQSMLWLIYPRLAWEVCSLTLLFLSFTIWLSRHILNGNDTFFYVFVFYLTNLIGTYNHIIFACIPLAIFVTALLFSLRKGYIDKKILTIAFCNITNIVLLYVLMNYFQGYFFEEHLGLSIIFIFSLIIVESFLVNKIDGNNIFLLRISHVVRRLLVSVFLVIGLAIFIMNHGIAFYDVLSNHKVLEHIYSFESLTLILVFNRIFAIILIIIFLRQTYLDLSSDNYLPILFILCYVILFSLFTTTNSPRYYLNITMLFYLYSAYAICLFSVKPKPMCCIIAIASCISIVQLAIIYTDKDYKYTPKYVSFGTLEEPSFHFFPIYPVVDYLRLHQIDRVETLSNDYFIKTPIQFIEYIKPWQKNPGIKVIVEYGETSQNGGFIIIQKN